MSEGGVCPHYQDELPEKRVHIKHFRHDNEKMTIVECEEFHKCCDMCAHYSWTRLQKLFLDFLGREDIDVLECPRGHVLMAHDQFLVGEAVDIMFEGHTTVDSADRREQ